MAVKSTFKNMAVCLMAICLVCSALLAGVYALTKSAIDSANEKKLAAAVNAVVPEYDSMSIDETVVMDGKEYPYNIVYLGGEPVAMAITSTVVGFGGPLTLLVGVTVDGIVYNTSVFTHSETPGLGAKCTEPAFHDQFAGWNPMEKTLIVKKDGGDVDAITASTITSRAYTLAVANAVKAAMLIMASEEASADEAAAEETNEEGGQDNE